MFQSSRARGATSQVLLAAAALLCVSACASYRPLSASIPGAEASLATVPEGPLAFDEAVRLLVRRHPRLCAARAEILAVNRNPGAKPLTARGVRLDGDITELTLETDLLSLLGVGSRSAARATATALAHERVLAYYEEGRLLVSRLAEAYAVERILRNLTAPDARLDIDSYRAAGLVPEAGLRAGDAAVAEARAEARVLALELAEARRAIVELIGATPGRDVAVAPVALDWPAVPDAEDTALVLSRGDLLRGFAAYRTADRAYREAVVRQYPDLELRLGGNIELDAPLQFVRLRLPLDAADATRAAQWARNASYERLRSQVLAARHDAASRRNAWETALANVRAAGSRRTAARALIQAETARVETDVTAFPSLVLVATADVQAARAERQAEVAAARARVRAAFAAGWPGADVIETAAKGGGS